MNGRMPGGPPARRLCVRGRKGRRSLVPKGPERSGAREHPTREAGDAQRIKGQEIRPGRTPERISPVHFQKRFGKSPEIRDESPGNSRKSTGIIGQNAPKVGFRKSLN